MILLYLRKNIVNLHSDNCIGNNIKFIISPKIMAENTEDKISWKIKAVNTFFKRGRVLIEYKDAKILLDKV